MLPAIVLLASASPTTVPQPGVPNCTVDWHAQTLDHFDFSEARQWRQRYFTFDTYGRRHHPLYCGNEASVELYVNATGFMWENAQRLGARLVFAEHRYYGESLPLGSESGANTSTLKWLTMEQALADYARSSMPSKAASRKRPVRCPWRILWRYACGVVTDALSVGRRRCDRGVGARARLRRHQRNRKVGQQFVLARRDPRCDGQSGRVRRWVRGWRACHVARPVRQGQECERPRVARKDVPALRRGRRVGRRGRRVEAGRVAA